MTITVASPDKLSISLFISFMRAKLGKSLMIVELNSLMAPDMMEKYVEGSLDKHSSYVLFTYHARTKDLRKDSPDPASNIPQKLNQCSDMIVWMDLFSTEWKVLKDSSGTAPEYLVAWQRGISRVQGA